MGNRFSRETTLKDKSQSRQDRKHYNGLRNQGGTCYLSSVVQCLFMTKEFRKAVERQKSDGLLLQLKEAFETLKVTDGSTKGITQSLGISNVCEQQDAVEYYQKILKGVGPPLSKVFEGKMSNKSKCLKNNHLYQQTHSFITIPLAINSKHNEVCSVKEEWDSFFKHTVLDEDNWLYCDLCDDKAETETWNEIEEFPTVLSIHLKRFDFDYMKMSYVKNDCRMDIPLNLQFKEDCNYDLYAVINHKGSQSGGHYNALIKSFEDDEWYCFDDISVTKASQNSLNHSRLAYLLLYRKAAASRKVPSWFKVRLHKVPGWCKVISMCIGIGVMCLITLRLFEGTSV